MIRALAWLMLALAATGGLFYGYTALRPPPPQVTTVVRHTSRSSGPTIEQVQKLSKLVVLRVPISDVQVSELDGLTGGLRLVLAIHGDVEIATDLDTARFEDIDPQNQSALLILRRPGPVRPRLDHDKTRIIELQRTGLWWWVNGQAGEQALTNRAMSHAQTLLADIAERDDLLTQACRHTETVIREFFGAMGWTVTVQWEDRQPSDQSSISSLD